MNNGALKNLLQFKTSLTRGSVLLADAKQFNRLLNDATQETGASFDDLKIQRKDLSRLESVQFSPDSFDEIVDIEPSAPFVQRELFDERMSAAIERLRSTAKPRANS